MLYCKCCGSILRVGTQVCSPKQAERMGIKEFKLVTCDNPDCVLRGYTLSENTHYNGDLTAYLKGKNDAT